MQQCINTNPLLYHLNQSLMKSLIFILINTLFLSLVGQAQFVDVTFNKQAELDAYDFKSDSTYLY